MNKMSYQHEQNDSDNTTTIVTDTDNTCQTCGVECKCHQVEASFDATYNIEVLSDANEKIIISSEGTIA